MKAVFIHQATLLRDSHIDPAAPEAGWQLMPATIEAVRLLPSEETLVLLYCARPDLVEHHGDDQEVPEELLRTARQLEAGGGRIDGVIGCGQAPATVDADDTPYPGLVWSAVAQRLEKRHAVHPFQLQVDDQQVCPLVFQMCQATLCIG
mgnify:CR=1 FL=1